MFTCKIEKCHLPRKKIPQFKDRPNTKMNKPKCDDPCSVLIPSSTRHCNLYQVGAIYTEQVIPTRLFQLFQLGYMNE